MKRVKKINGLFRRQPLTTERIAGLAEAETTGEQVRLADGESSPFGGYSPGSQKARVAEEMAEDAVAATDGPQEREREKFGTELQGSSVARGLPRLGQCSGMSPEAS